MNNDVLARAQRAQRLLENSDFLETFDHVKRELFSEWSQCRDDEQLKSIHTEMVGMDRLFKKIKAYLSHAAIEQHNANARPD